MVVLPLTDEAKRQLAFSANCVLACVRCLVFLKVLRMACGGLTTNTSNYEA